MKQRVVEQVKRVAPRPAVQAVRRGYHTARTHAASAWYRYPARLLKVIAVVGTTGKTTTALYLDSILTSAGFTTAVLTSEATTVAGVTRPAASVMTAQRVQRFLRQAKKADVDYVVVEAPSWALEARLFHTVAFECIVMTNTETPEDTAAIAQLLAYIPRFSVLNADDAAYQHLVSYEASEHTMSYGTSEAADSRIRQVKLYKRGSEARLLIDHHTTLELGTQLPGKHNVYNMTAAAMAAYLMYIKLEAIADGIAELAPVAGRFERLELDKPYDVILDRATTLGSVTSVLESARGMAKNRLIVVVPGDTTPEVADVLVKSADRLFVSGSDDNSPLMVALHSAGGEAKTERIADPRDATTKATSVARTGDVVVRLMGQENNVHDLVMTVVDPDQADKTAPTDKDQSQDDTL
ncbi:MAG: Mur ligase family protein [Candidatus Saccharimonadales bacterium]